MATHTPAMKGPFRILIIMETDKRFGEKGQGDSLLGKASLCKHKNNCLNARTQGKAKFSRCFCNPELGVQTGGSQGLATSLAEAPKLHVQ